MRNRFSLVEIFANPSGVVISTLAICSVCGLVVAWAWSPNLDQVAQAKTESLAYQLSQAQTNAAAPVGSRSIASDESDLIGKLGKDPWGKPFQYQVHREYGLLKVKVWSATRPDLKTELSVPVAVSKSEP